MSNIISGECHCGNIRIHLHTKKMAWVIVPRSCSCGFCKKHQASWVSDANGKVHVKYADESRVSSYRFGTKTAEFVVCDTCGVLVLSICDIEGRLRAVLNTRCMDAPFDAAVTTDFDGEDVQSRLARRAKNWTGNVIFD